MSDQYEDPVIQGRKLRAAIRSMRVNAELTQRDVANDLYWSVSKVVRIENGDSRISVNDLRALMDRCGLDDPDQREELIRLSRMSRRQNFLPYRDIVHRNFLTYLRLESIARTIRTFESSIIPGLLQTEEYARAIIGAYRAPDSAESTIALLVQLRMERQEILDRGEDRRFQFIIDESALRRSVGGSKELMERQFEHLLSVAEKPNVTVGIIPFSAGQYTGMGGPFVHLELSGPGEDDSIFLETAYGDYFARDAADDTRRYLEVFLELEAISEAATLSERIEKARSEP
ncbi:helix-turn-helix domain-containing protein [Actinoplanes sp. NPDC020271]|uniref:helix-turn-helix domain-containing protein n=1 Tax=Actinoplanes sp. NPDC020271 TaxID=3363896 RepID=UPI003793A6BF